MIDANTYALNKYLSGEEQLEKIQDELIDSVEWRLSEIVDHLEAIRDVAKDFEGYDLTEFINVVIDDTV